LATEDIKNGVGKQFLRISFEPEISREVKPMKDGDL
jgi:hypothetical protein